MDETSDPRKYFKFKRCSQCLQKPCDMLRFGGVYPGKINFVHNSHYGTGFSDCPFEVQEFDEVERLLAWVSTEDLIDHINNLLCFFTPAEYVQYNQQDYVSFYDDVAGRINFLRALWDNNVMSVLRVPFFIKDDAVMRKWLYAYEGLVYMLKKPELDNKSGGKAVTDALADQQAQLDLNNPRWKHTDAGRDKESPDTAAIGDVVMLMASAPGFDDGSPVTFAIYDSSGGSPVKIDSVKGKADGGRAEAEWTVSDPNDAGDKLDLDFEASAKDKNSGKAKIPTKFVFEILLQIDVDDPAAQDDVLILLDEDNNEVKKLPVKDMKEVSEDIVKIVIEDIDMDKKYSMIRDYGAEDDGGHDPLFIKLTPKELMRFSKDPGDEDDQEGEGGEDAGDTDSGDDNSGDESVASDDDLDYSWAFEDSAEVNGDDGAEEENDKGDNVTHVSENDSDDKDQAVSDDSENGQGEKDET